MTLKSNSSEAHISPREDFWGKFRPKNQSGRSMLYRFEHEGILVYDSYARLSTESTENKPKIIQKEINPQPKKEIESGNEYGKF